jgi:hypothetical protein
MNCFHGVIGLSHSPFVAAAYIVVCDYIKRPNRFRIFQNGDFTAAKRPLAADGNGVDTSRLAVIATPSGSARAMTYHWRPCD